MRELYLAMKAGDARRLVGLTFDDGYEDFLHTALPILERTGFSATVFVVAGMLGKENTWQHRGGPRPRLRLLGVSGVREVSERGMEIGSHTLTHPRLSGLNRRDLVREVSDSRQILSEIVGTPIDGFCYPYGNLDETAVQGVRETGYTYACATKKRVENTVYDWPRIYVGDKDSPPRLATKLIVTPWLSGSRGFRQRGAEHK
jgi:peptidoglycan/xylan/chitin deacetylase (PgdA/CDA1 family)